MGGMTGGNAVLLRGAAQTNGLTCVEPVPVCATSAVIGSRYETGTDAEKVVAPTDMDVVDLFTRLMNAPP